MPVCQFKPSKARDNNQEEETTNIKVEAEAEEETVIQEVNQISRVELDPKPGRKRSDNTGGSEIEGICREMEDIEGPMVLQGDQGGIEASVHEASQSLGSTITIIAREQKGDTRVFRQRRSRKNFKSRQRALLLRNTTRGKESPNTGLFATKPVFEVQSFQNGRHEDGHEPDRKKRLVDKDRYKRRVPSHSITSKRVTSSGNKASRWNTLEMQGDAVWSEYRSFDIHETDASSIEAIAQRRNSYSRISGRSFDNFEFHGASGGEHSRSDPMAGIFGIYPKLQEVHVMPVTGDIVLGYADKYRRDDSECSPREDQEGTTGSTPNPQERQLVSTEVGGHNWHHELCMQGHVTRDAHDAVLTSQLDRCPFEEQEQLGHHEGRNLGHLEGGTPLVGGRHDQVQWPALSTICNGDDHPNGCIRNRMGWSMWRVFMLGVVVGHRLLPILEHEGAVSDPEGDRSHEAEGQEQEVVNHVRQHNGNCKCGEGRRQLQHRVYPEVEGSVLAVQEPELYDSHEVYSGEKQRICGCSIQTQLQGRILPKTACHRSNHSEMGQTVSRHVCDQREQNRSQVLLMESGSGSISNRCIQPVMERREATICASTNSVNTKSDSEIQGGTDQEDDTGATTLDITSNLANSDGAQERPDSPSEELHNGTAQSPTIHPVPTNDSGFATIPIDRDTYVREKARFTGLTETTLQLLGKGKVKDSTRKSYGTAWRAFAAYCNLHHFEPEKPASIANWLASLNAAGLNAKSIRTYCVAVCSTIETASGERVGKSSLIALTLRTLKVNGNRTIKNLAGWDVQTALGKLRNINTKNFHDLSQKTVFLIALCTCWRPASDLSRIPRESVRFLDCGSVEMQAVDVKEGGSKIVRLMPFSDKSICPAATLLSYIQQTESFRKEDSRYLFVTREGRDASSDSLRRWMSEMFEKVGIDTEKFKPHSTRAVSSSTLWTKGRSMHEIMKLANWSSADTFRRFYWKPVTESEDLPTNGIQGLLQSPFEVLPSNNEAPDVILSVIRDKATATTPHPASPKARKKVQKRAEVTPVKGRREKKVKGCGG